MLDLGLEGLKDLSKDVNPAAREPAEEARNTTQRAELPQAMVDAHQMQQVFVNILNNARQAIESHQPKGWIKVKTETRGTHVRITIQPIDEPPDGAMLDRVVEQLGSDKVLLFSTDYPHWHFDGMDALPNSLAHIRSGAVRALAVMSPQRNPAIPEVPAMNEIVSGIEIYAGTGIGVPAKTPPDIVERLNREINASLADSSVKSRYADVGAVPIIVTPDEARARIARDIEKWRKVIETAGLKPE